MTNTLTLRHEVDRGTIAGRLDEIADSAVDIVAPASALAVRYADITEPGDPQGFLILPTSHAVVQEDGVHSTLPVRFTRTGFRQMVERLDIPLKYADLVRDDDPALLDINVARRSESKDAPTLFRLIRDGDQWICRAVLSNSYQAIDNLDMFIAVINGAAKAGVDIGDCLVEGDWTDDRFRLRIAVPQVGVMASELLKGYRNPFEGGQLDWTQHTSAFQRELRERGAQVGDALWAGIEASNSETGGGAATVGPRAIVLICLNGLTRKTDIVRQVHLGGKLDVGPVTWSAETQKKAVELVESKMADAVRAYCSEGYLEGLIREMEQAKGVDVQNPVTAFEVAKTRLGFSEEERDRALTMFIRGQDTTVLGVANAVTAMAQTVDDGDRQNEIEQTFWDIVNNPAAYQGRELIGAGGGS